MPQCIHPADQRVTPLLRTELDPQGPFLLAIQAIEDASERLLLFLQVVAQARFVGEEGERAKRNHRPAAHQRGHHRLMPISDRAEPFDIFGSRIDHRLRELGGVDRRVERAERIRLHRCQMLRTVDRLDLIGHRMRSTPDRVDVENLRHHGREFRRPRVTERSYLA